MIEENSSEKLPGGDGFVKRLFDLPMMATAIGQLSSFYSSTKDRNRLLKLTLETAESGVGVIVSTAVPVVSRFDKGCKLIRAASGGWIKEDNWVPRSPIRTLVAPKVKGHFCGCNCQHCTSSSVRIQ